MFLAKISVTNKNEIKNPEAQTLERLLDTLEISQIKEIKCTKTYNFKIDSTSKEQAFQIAENIAQTILANPIIEEYKVEICEQV